MSKKRITQIRKELRLLDAELNGPVKSNLPCGDTMIGLHKYVDYLTKEHLRLCDELSTLQSA